MLCLSGFELYSRWVPLAFLGVQQRANGRWLTDQSEHALYFCYVIACGSKRFQSSYCAKVREGAKKKVPTFLNELARKRSATQGI